MKKQITKKTIETSLNSLGKTPTAIANSLRKRGIKGLQATVYSCPIAEFIKQEFAVHKVTVGNYRIVVARFSSLLPGPISRFIQLFDDDKFKFLIAK